MASNKFTGKILDAKILEKKLVDKSNISNPIKNSDLDAKLKTLETKVEFKAQ